MSQQTKEQKHAEYMRHRDKYIARASKWAKDNPDKRREISQRDNIKRSDIKKKWHQLKRYENIIEMVECIKCGTTEKLLVHHADGNNGKMGNPLNNDIENLIVLCRHCHPKVHYRGIIREVLTNGI